MTVHNSGPGATRNRRRLATRFTRGFALVLVGVWGCGDSGADPVLDILAFSASAIQLDAGLSGRIQLTNDGSRTVGPIELKASAIRRFGGTDLTGRHLQLTPTDVPTLAPGATFEVAMEIVGTGTLVAGQFGATVTARLSGQSQATTEVAFQIDAGDPGLVAGLQISLETGPMRQGEIRPADVTTTGSGGSILSGFEPEWSTIPSDGGVVVDGTFVAYRSGEVQVVAQIGNVSDTVSLQVTPRGRTGEFTRLGAGVELDRHTSDLWVHGDYAYVGSWGTRSGPGGTMNGNLLSTWNITGPFPGRTAAVRLDARTINDVKVRAAGDFVIVTHEGSDDGLNGFTILEISTPHQPIPIKRFTEGMSPGVHNLWVEGDYLYVVLDGAGGLRIVDISTPTNPVVVWSFYAGTSFLHDVMVRDGLAFLSHWDAGLIVFDVGNGIVGGTPTAPVEVSRIQTLGGNTHNAWYWPEGGYVFVGQEDFGAPGYLHVIDFSSPTNPKEVANFVVPGQTPHNFWMDESNETLFAAWYGQGLRALDVSGKLIGDLAAQGREMGSILYNGGTGVCGNQTSTCAWAPQLHDGQIFVSDQNNGLVVLRWTGN